ncbi:MAG: hypothetical protein ACPGDB_02630 [Fusobacterium sp.]
MGTIKQKCRVVALETSKAPALYLFTHEWERGETSEYRITKGSTNTVHDNKPLHLYITSDDEIKVGDWYINFQNNFVCKADARYGELKNPIHHNKIIATTEVLLIKQESAGSNEDMLGVPINYEEVEEVLHDVIVPRIPQSFVTEYVTKNGIDEVMVEYEYKLIGTYKLKDRKSNVELIPILSETNDIVVSTIKYHWNRKEYEQDLIYCVAEFAAERGLATTSHEMKDINEWTKNWINNNS